jgi:SP family general alpha glucoside:H+ symporter-like MFS transporter
MSSGIIDEKRDEEMHEKGVQHQETLSDKDLMANAYEAENREHEMGLWEAIKDHPMACFWAFIFCFTIVSSDVTVA